MLIDRLIRQMRSAPEHKVSRPRMYELFLLRGEVLPFDLRWFYNRCGEARLFYKEERYLTLLEPTELISANKRIVGKDHDYDISSYWYVFAQDADGEYLSIDLHPKRLGRIYDTNHVNHALEGYTPIIALSFSEFLERSLNYRPNYYWLDRDFRGYGDAYDNIEVEWDEDAIY
ncbi:SMI1/KNR4 family protein [Deinococcus roseus]|uniref:SMI1/KNR4 family protein n=1 Tax=Deinococcus roseus TaxID=392414 RepID=A0ABQ2CVJ1_9DEIO|nr:SMI1/KNR4 family protein [Deinococcus roseus]GGJ24590.1 SMI1/KNR4 family protein [Deinococcus roseus]